MSEHTTSTEIDNLLEQLHKLLSIDDTRVNDLIKQAEPPLISHFGEPAWILARQIESFEYPAALTTLETIRRGDTP
jgi:hypothetical protein